MKAIFEQVTAPNVKICWNSNPTDLLSPGLEANFNMVKKWLGDTIHTHGFGSNEYPHQQLFNLLAGINYSGWMLLEESTDPADKIAALNEKSTQFNELLANTIKS